MDTQDTQTPQQVEPPPSFRAQLVVANMGKRAAENSLAGALDKILEAEAATDWMRRAKADQADSLTHERNDADDRAEVSRRQVKSAKDQTSKVQQQLALARDERALVKVQYQSMLKDYRLAADRADAEHAKRGQAESALASVKIGRDDAQAACARLTSERDAAQAGLSETDRECVELQRKLDQFATSLEALGREHTHARRALDTAITAARVLEHERDNAVSLGAAELKIRLRAEERATDCCALAEKSERHANTRDVHANGWQKRAEAAEKRAETDRECVVLQTKLDQFATSLEALTHEHTLVRRALDDACTSARVLRTERDEQHALGKAELKLRLAAEVKLTGAQEYGDRERRCAEAYREQTKAAEELTARERAQNLIDVNAIKLQICGAREDTSNAVRKFADCTKERAADMVTFKAGSDADAKRIKALQGALARANTQIADLSGGTQRT